MNNPTNPHIVSRDEPIRIAANPANAVIDAYREIRERECESYTKGFLVGVVFTVLFELALWWMVTR
jgi:hypothetical protein